MRIKSGPTNFVLDPPMFEEITTMSANTRRKLLLIIGCGFTLLLVGQAIGIAIKSIPV